VRPVAASRQVSSTQPRNLVGQIPGVTAGERCGSAPTKSVDTGRQQAHRTLNTPAGAEPVSQTGLFCTSTPLVGVTLLRVRTCIRRSRGSLLPPWSRASRDPQAGMDGT
jgi:hypothetical protein